jgi:hypothetical protein
MIIVIYMAIICLNPRCRKSRTGKILSSSVISGGIGKSILQKLRTS